MENQLVQTKVIVRKKDWKTVEIWRPQEDPVQEKWLPLLDAVRHLYQLSGTDTVFCQVLEILFPERLVDPRETAALIEKVANEMADAHFQA